MINTVMTAMTETEIHLAVADHLRRRAVDGLVWWACPNGGKRSPVEAAIFQGLGVRAGASDLMALHAGTFYALELKAEAGKVSRAQEQFLAAVASAGGRAYVAYGLDEALCVLEDWGLLRGVAMLTRPRARDHEAVSKR